MDFDRPAGIDLTGVDTLVLISAGYAEDDVVIARHRSVLEAARRDGVGHVIYTSLVGEGAVAAPTREDLALCAVEVALSPTAHCGRGVRGIRTSALPDADSPIRKGGIRVWKGESAPEGGETAGEERWTGRAGAVLVCR